MIRTYRGLFALAFSIVSWSTDSHAALLDVGISHACAVVDQGVRCWGENAQGTLGNPKYLMSALAIDVLGLEPGTGKGVSAVATGPHATCAVTNGGLICWGDNYAGQLGTGGQAGNVEVPTLVIGLEPGAGHDVTAVAVGNFHSCAVASGGVLCWGQNDQGQLGDGTTASRTTAKAVAGLEPGTGKGVLAIAVGVNHSCAAGIFGVKCWGRNIHPTFGPSNQSALPLLIPNLLGPISVMDAADDTTCVVSGGQLQCWGDGPLGNGQAAGSDTPVTIGSLPGPIKSISLGKRAQATRHSCAIAFATAYCWGGGTYGQLGGGNSNDQLTPQAVAGFTAATGAAFEIAAGDLQTCGIHSTGGLRCWGSVGFGLLGNGASARELSATPVASPATSGVTQLATSGDGLDGHSCAVIASKAWCWGSNTHGELGDGSVAGALAPIQATVPGNVTSVSVGYYHSCAVTSGQVWCWGSNEAGQLGRDPANLPLSLSPIQVPGIDQAVAVYGGGFGVNHTCARTATNALYCWGANDLGQTGAAHPDGSADTDTFWQPKQVFADSVTAVALGAGHTCAIVAGGVACWGDDQFGELGNGAGGSGPLPALVEGMGPGAGVTSIGAGLGQTCAVRQGGVQCWGVDSESVLGSAPSFSEIPHEVGLPAGSGVTLVSTSGLSTCAIASGTALCWGIGITGALGSGDSLDRDTPSLVAGLESNVSDIVTAGFHTCAVSQGAASCWGLTTGGRLGNFTTGIQATPVSVVAADLFRSGFE
jgi:alpha-tubulin suppressor-like RCC1 family protein